MTYQAFEVLVDSYAAIEVDEGVTDFEKGKPVLLRKGERVGSIEELEPGKYAFRNALGVRYLGPKRPSVRRARRSK